MKIRSTKAIRYHIDGMVDPLKEMLDIPKQISFAQWHYRSQ